ncbi:ESF1 homolog [Pimephales promelas]|uniref:ESF1 homolog n=1 Tax=Pimephales promelas TaxID=90988 RepID=UPI0019555D2E|nr:ESF1 homolog [Pimephales promelas]
MGGAEKIRMKKKKTLAREAAKCAKLTDLFREKGAAVAEGNVTDEEGGPSSRTAVKVSDGEGQVEDDPCSHIDDEGEKEEEQEEGEQQEKDEQEEKNGTSIKTVTGRGAVCRAG